MPREPAMVIGGCGALLWFFAAFSYGLQDHTAAAVAGVAGGVLMVVAWWLR